MSRFRSIQRAIAARISEKEFFARKNIRVLSRDVKDLESEIENALSSVGVTVFIFPPEPSRSLPNLRKPIFDRCKLRIRVIESPITNATGSDAWDVWEELARTLHQWRSGLEDTGTIYLAETPFDDQTTPDRPELVFDLNLEMQLGLEERNERT